MLGQTSWSCAGCLRFAFLLATLGVLALAPWHVARAQICGDADGDGTVTVADGVNVLRAAAALPSTCQTGACDVDRDGTVTIADGVNVLRGAASLPNPCSSGITATIDTARAGLVDGVTVSNVTIGTLRIGVAPIPAPGAPTTIGGVTVVGQPAAIGDLTRDIRIPYNVSDGSPQIVEGDTPTLIVTVRRGDGSDVDGFFEIPLVATAADNAVTGFTFPTILGSEAFTVRVATRFGDVVSQFIDVGLTPVPASSAELSFVETVGFPGTFSGFTAFGKPRAIASVDGANVYVASKGAVTAFRREAATGRLTFIESEVGAPDCTGGVCADTAVAISPDDAHVYFGSETFGSLPELGPLAVFRRDPATGALTFVEAHRIEPSSIAVSRDGAHVYACSKGSFATNRLSVFRRDAVTGALTFVEAHGDDLLSFPTEVIVSPDDKHVYVVGGKRAIFQRDAVSGKLTFVSSESTSGPTSIAITSDGTQVYTTTSVFGGGGEGSVDVFDRNPSTGALTLIETEVNGAEGVDGLLAPEALTTSPDGSRVYVASFGTFFGKGALSVFRRDPLTGKLTFLETRFNGVGGISGLNQPLSLVTSPDGAHVYTTEVGADADDPRVGIYRMMIRDIYVSHEIPAEFEVSGCRYRPVTSGTRSWRQHPQTTLSTAASMRRISISAHRGSVSLANFIVIGGVPLSEFHCADALEVKARRLADSARSLPEPIRTNANDASIERLKWPTALSSCFPVASIPTVARPQNPVGATPWGFKSPSDTWKVSTSQIPAPRRSPALCVHSARFSARTRSLT